jgi:hypothetical protein
VLFLSVDAAITRERIAQQTVCLPPLNNEVRRRAARGHVRSLSRTPFSVSISSIRCPLTLLQHRALFWCVKKSDCSAEPNKPFAISVITEAVIPHTFNSEDVGAQVSFGLTKGEQMNGEGYD